MAVPKIADGIGRGLLAGLAGTVAMTVSSTIEQRLRKRSPSVAPAEAAARVLGIEKFRSDTHERRFSTLVHWAYGAGWGVYRGLLAAAGLSEAAAGAAHLATMWGCEQVMLPALEIAPPVTMWGRTEVAIDGWHHVVHMVATGIAFRFLFGRG